jgi:hypothetical protein
MVLAFVGCRSSVAEFIDLTGGIKSTPDIELTSFHSQGSMNSATGQRFANDSITALGRCQLYNIFTKIQAGHTKKAYAKKVLA